MVARSARIELKYDINHIFKFIKPENQFKGKHISTINEAYKKLLYGIDYNKPEEAKEAFDKIFSLKPLKKETNNRIYHCWAWIVQRQLGNTEIAKHHHETYIEILKRAGDYMR